MASEGLFRAGIVSFLISQAMYIVLPLLLYKLLKSVSNTHGVLMVLFIVLAIPIAFINELNRFAALLVLSGANYLTVVPAEQLQAQAMLFLDLHKDGIMIAQVFWGLWLFPMGYLVFKSGFLPRILGVLLMIGSLGYVIDSVMFFLFPQLNVKVGQFTFVGELLFPLWLLIKGVNVEKWKERALESA